MDHLLFWAILASGGACFALLLVGFRLRQKRGRRRENLRMIEIQLRLETALYHTKAAWGGIAPGLPPSVFVGVRKASREGVLSTRTLDERAKQTELSCDI